MVEKKKLIRILDMENENIFLASQNRSIWTTTIAMTNNTNQIICYIKH